MNERTIFLQALDKPTAEERAAYLAEACGGDAALRQRVEQLLQSHEQAAEFLCTPAMAAQAAAEATPADATATHPSAAAGGAGGEALDFLDPPRRPGSLGRLDHYEVLDVVGRGGMGVVLRAFDEKLHRVVALKVMAREIAGSCQARKRFSREAKAAAAVVHDHIVPIHAIEEAGPVPYLVMQYVEGQSLQQKIDAEGSLELKEVLRIGTQIASGLAAAHRQGLVHRDIKPANILLENGLQRVKITDFGLARAVDDATVSQAGVVTGTPQYMSPEQADGQPVDHRSDLFSLGSVLYAMCTGRAPFRAGSTVATLKRVCEDTPRPIRELNPDMPDWLCDIIARLHAKKPSERFQNAQEVAGLLERHLAEVQQMSTGAVAPVRLAVAPSVAQRSFARHGRWRRAAVALALLALAGVAFLAYRYALGTAYLQLEGVETGDVIEFERSGLAWRYIAGDRGLGTLRVSSNFDIVQSVPSPYSATASDVTLKGRAGSYTMRVGRVGGTTYWIPVWLVAGETATHRLPPRAEMLSPSDVAAAQSDADRLQGDWEGCAVRYVGGPALGREALPLTWFRVRGSTFRLRLPGMDYSGEFRVSVSGRSRRLLLNGTSSTGTFRIARPEIAYEFQNDGLRLRIDGPQPSVTQETYRQQGLPIPTPVNQGLEIFLRRKGDLQTGSPAPDIVGEDLDGRPFKLSAHRDKVVVIDFWADWCGYCRQMYTWKRRLSERRAGQPFLLVGVNGDDASATAKRAVQRERLAWPSLWDGQRVAVPGAYSPGPIAAAFHVDALPTLVILDGQGVIRHRLVGMPTDVAELDRVIDNLLADNKTESPAAGENY